MSEKAVEVLVEALREQGAKYPNASASLILEALKAAGIAVVEVPTIGFKGPNDTDASMLRTAADKAESAKYPVGGSNVGAAVASVLRQVADARVEVSDE
jgi:uroporphyrinogen-III synthase